MTNGGHVSFVSPAFWAWSKPNEMKPKRAAFGGKRHREAQSAAAIQTPSGVLGPLGAVPRAPKKLRKSAAKSMKSLARVNLCASAAALAQGSLHRSLSPSETHRPIQASASRLSSVRRSGVTVASLSASPEWPTASATQRQPVSHSASGRPWATQARWQEARKALLSAFGASGPQAVSAARSPIRIG